LFFLLSFAHSETNLYFVKVGKGLTETRIYSSQEIQYASQDIKDSLLFLHAASGCGATSLLYHHGKKKALKLLQNTKDLRQELAVFKLRNATHEVAGAGEGFMLRLYEHHSL
jgi:hypothetical protein